MVTVPKLCGSGMLYKMGRIKGITSLVFVCLLALTAAELTREVYEYTDCKGAYQKRLGLEDGRIPDSSMSASSFNTKRPAKDGRVGRSAGAWSPSIQNANQWLQVDLGKQYIVTAVYTQGRQGSDEYVREFFLEYSDDGSTWRRYTNQLGIPEMFEGNHDDSSLQMRVLNYPIVAKFIRFNPQRWNMVISLRAEIVGCPFEADTASFDGESYIEFDMSRGVVQTTSDLLEMRFKTGKPNGVLMYASGNQGDLMMLEMKRGYLYFKIDLGSTATSKGMTEIKAASLLDDNQWHDVVITRDKHDLQVVVDRLINRVTTNGLFYRLDMDKSMFLGGVPYFNQEGITVKNNFIGCLQNVNLNGGKLVRDAMSGTIATVSIIKNVNPYCNVVAKRPVTFPTLESYLLAPGQSGRVIHVAFEFRTHDRDGLLVYHEMDTEDAKVVIQIDQNGHINYTINLMTGQPVEDVVRNTDVLSTTDAFTDGLWHSFYLYIDSEKINCTVDRNSKVSLRKLDVRAQTEFYIGGHELFNGFKGCMRDIQVAQKIVNLDSLITDTASRVVGAQIGTCAIRDRCTPNPCEHGGLCEQSWSTFQCNCDQTGYQGALCHISAYHISCAMHKYYSNKEGKEEAMLDPDGSGPLSPFKASCERNDDGDIITYIGHDSMGPIRVNGYQDPGSYVRKITYAASDILELDEVIDRSRTCRQSVLYRCKNARFLSSPGDLTNPNITTWGWWVGRTFQPMYYWGGAAPGSGKCKCGLEEEGCGNQSSTCYCDKVNTQGISDIDVDQGYLQHKEYLPVIELHLGDTGSTTDDKWSEHEIGELECFGDNLFDNTVTFTQQDGALEFPTFEATNAGDIWFQFKTTASDGVMIHCAGSQVSDFIEIRLFQSDTIQFRYDVGNGVAVLAFKSPSPLSDDTWHTVHVEKNRKQAWMRIDDYSNVVLNEDADLIRQLDLTTPLYVGSLVGYQDGYVGCMRGLRVNGRLMDMMGKLRGKGEYGVRAGCMGKCASNPCFNQGTCREGYNHYRCDCSYTPWRGWNCGREVGVNLKSNYMIQYEFGALHGPSASDLQRATIGFSTKVKQGILMQMRNEENTEYISVEMNNNGGIKVAMDVGFERVEVNTRNELGIDYADSQTHVFVMERSNSGRDLKVQVDNYPPGMDSWGGVSDQFDTILDNPKYLFIGNNDTSNTNRGFEGCIFRMQVDNIFPLKQAFQDPKPDYITLIPGDKVREDMCGFEEVTVSPEPIQTRPFAGILQNVTHRRVTDPPLSDEEKALVGGEACGGEFQGKGTIRSPNYPRGYPPDTDCVWTLSGYNVSLTFISLSVSCEDGVFVYDGNNATHGLIGKFCGADVPGTILSTSNQLHLVLRSSNTTATSTKLYWGFQAEFTSDECASNQNDCDQVCTNTDDAFVCSCYEGYELRDDERTCVEHQALYINTTQDSNGLELVCYLIEGKDNIMSHVDVLVISRTGETPPLASVSVHYNDGKPMSHLVDAEVTSYVTNAGHGPEKILHLRILWPHPQAELSGNYTCSADGVDSNLIPVIRSRSVIVDVRQPQPSLVAVPEVIREELTESLVIRCQVSNMQALNISQIATIYLSSVHGGSEQLLAEINVDSGLTVKQGAATSDVDGSLGNSDSFLELTWAYPGNENAGNFSCEVVGLQASGQLAVFTSQVEVTWEKPTYEEILAQLKDVTQSLKNTARANNLYPGLVVLLTMIL